LQKACDHILSLVMQLGFAMNYH